MAFALIVGGLSLVRYQSDQLTTAPQNLFANPAGPAAQDVAVQPGMPYSVRVEGPGAVALYGAVSAIATRGHPVSFVALSKVLSVAPAGPVTSIVISPGLDVVPASASPPTQTENQIHASVAVIGCHAGGLGAAVTFGRLGLSTVMTCAESTPGGMLTAGQIGFVDGSPIQAWQDTPGFIARNGQIPANSAWSTTSGAWLTIRQAIAAEVGSDLRSTLRYEPRVAARAIGKLLAELRSVRVLTLTSVVAAQLTTGGNQLESVAVSGGFTGTISADYWIDGTDAGDLVGIVGLPYRSGEDDGSAGGNDRVMDYAYRWTAQENDAGLFPVNPPMYYSINKEDLDAFVTHIWPTYRADFGLPDGVAWQVHPFRLQNAQGRLSGDPKDGVQTLPTGEAIAGKPVEIWDVNGSLNEAGSFLISRMLFTNPAVTALFARYGQKNPYGPSSSALYEWANLTFVQDRAGLLPADRQFLIERIKEAVRAKASAALYYIRSGDMLDRLRKQPGAQNVTLRSHWSIDNQLGTSDGLPELIYQREGRRIVGEYEVLITDLDPSYVSDVAADRVAHTPPVYFNDAVVVGDYNSDIHRTVGRAPDVFALPWPKQLPLRALIPRGTAGIAVTSAISADRRAYSAFRLDPIRVMTGGALAVVVQQALLAGTKRLQDLSPIKFRDALAWDYHSSAYYKWAPRLDLRGGRLVDLELGVSVQRLLAAGWLTHEFTNNPGDGTGAPNADSPLTGSRGAALWDLVKAQDGLPQRAPWNTNPASPAVTALSSLTGTPATGDARVADAMIWLAARLPQR